MSKYKQYLLRLNPQDPEDAALIARLDAAGKEWGGVQRMIKNALARYQDAAQSSPSPAPSTALLEDLSRAVPNLSPAAAEAMAGSPPLRHIQALYAALDAFSPQSLTEIEGRLLQTAIDRIQALLNEAAERRQPIRAILQEQGGDA